MHTIHEMLILTTATRKKKKNAEKCNFSHISWRITSLFPVFNQKLYNVTEYFPLRKTEEISNFNSDKSEFLAKMFTLAIDIILLKYNLSVNNWREEKVQWI